MKYGMKEVFFEFYEIENGLKVVCRPKMDSKNDDNKRVLDELDCIRTEDICVFKHNEKNVLAIKSQKDIHVYAEIVLVTLLCENDILELGK